MVKLNGLYPCLDLLITSYKYSVIWHMAPLSQSLVVPQTVGTRSHLSRNPEKAILKLKLHDLGGGEPIPPFLPFFPWKWKINELKGNSYWREPSSTSMLMGGRVVFGGVITSGQMGPRPENDRFHPTWKGNGTPYFREI